jgi:hypothetical protein
MVAYGVSRPFPGAGGLTDQDWRDIGSAWSDGIVNAVSPGGSSDFMVAPSTGNRTLVMNLGQIRIRGVHFRPSVPTLTLTLPDVAEGSSRADRIIARYDPAAANDDKITFLVRSGTAVTTGSPVRPSITRVAGGVWEVPLWVFTGGNVPAGALPFEDHRIFVTSHLHGLVPPGQNTTLNLGFPDGTQYFDLPTGQTWVQTYPGGVATWSNVDDPPWTPLTRGTGLVNPPTSLRAAEWRVCRGELQMQGSLQTATTPWVGFVPGGPTLTEKSLGALPASVADRIGFSRFVPIALQGSGPAMARGVVTPTGAITFFMPPGIDYATMAAFDGVRFALEA